MPFVDHFTPRLSGFEEISAPVARSNALTQRAYVLHDLLNRFTWSGDDRDRLVVTGDCDIFALLDEFDDLGKVCFRLGNVKDALPHTR